MGPSPVRGAAILRLGTGHGPKSVMSHVITAHVSCIAAESIPLSAVRQTLSGTESSDPLLECRSGRQLLSCGVPKVNMEQVVVRRFNLI